MTLRGQRLEILRKVELGELSVEESNRLLETLERNADQASDLYPATEAFIQSPAASAETEYIPPSAEWENPERTPDPFEEKQMRRWRWLALVPFWLSVGLTALSAFWMYQGYDAHGFGWGFFLSWIPFLFGLAGMFIFWGARWLHVRIRQKPGKKPASINISLPLPLHAAGWFLRTFRSRLPRDLQEKNIDEMLGALDGSLTKDTPFHVYVDDDGEQVEVFIG